MNFIETLKSIGCVKPCSCTNGKYVDRFNRDQFCADCHGTGQILDLAPLLAKPKELSSVVGTFFHRINLAEWSRDYGSLSDIHIVGPQRASNLVYEIARQLGGTAVVTIPHKRGYDKPEQGFNIETIYELSLPIPDNSKVLFVTDRVDIKEMLAIEKAVGNVNALPYLLALVSDRDIWKNEACKVISLYQENRR